MFTGDEIVSVLQQLGTTDVVWIPDSAIGLWETALVRAKGMRLIRVCREGEAWPLAAGLLLGGKRPMVIMQSTGLFESGDALRNILFDFKLPLLSIIGARSYLLTQSTDTARKFINPLLQAWRMDYVLIEREDQKPQLAEHLLAKQKAGVAASVVIAEGRM